jgi:hypothetical protein
MSLVRQVEEAMHGFAAGPVGSQLVHFLAVLAMRPLRPELGGKLTLGRRDREDRS